MGGNTVLVAGANDETSSGYEAEEACSWPARLLFLFHEDLRNACGRYPRTSLLQRVLTHRFLRQRSTRDIAALPPSFRCSQTRTELTEALSASHGRLVHALCSFERRRLWQVALVAVFAAVLSVVEASLLIELLRFVTQTRGDLAVSSLVLRVGALQVVLVAVVVAKGHVVWLSAKTTTRMTTALQSLVMQRLMTGACSDLVIQPQQLQQDEDAGVEVVPALQQLRGLFRHIDTVVHTLGCQSRGFLVLTKLTGICVLLEIQVSAGSGAASVTCCGLGVLAFNFARRWVTWKRRPWDAAYTQMIHTLHEYLNDVLPVQLYAWEGKLRARVLEARQRAAEARASQLVTQIAVVSGSWGAQWLSVGVVLVVLQLCNVELSVFVVLAVLLTVGRHFREVWDDLAPVWRCKDSVAALERFLLSLPSLDPAAPVKGDKVPRATGVPLSRQHHLLVNASLSLKMGELIMVHGKAGVGKSLLLRALVNQHQATTSSGSERTTNATVAFCEQQPWLQHASIRENIVFGELFDARKYRCVLEACALFPDLEMLPAGDQTLVHPRGANLSGGQRARVALARACYANAELHVLDSTLDSVDPIVRHEVFAKCLSHLLVHKTVVLATHDPELISSACADVCVHVKDSDIIVRRTKRVAMSSSTSKNMAEKVDELGGAIGFCGWIIASSVMLFVAIKATGVAVTSYLDALFFELTRALTTAPVAFFERLDVNALVSNLWIDLKATDWSWHYFVDYIASSAGVVAATTIFWTWISGPYVLLWLLPLAAECAFLTSDPIGIDIYASKSRVLAMLEHAFEEVASGLTVVHAFGPACQRRFLQHIEAVINLLNAQSLVMRPQNCYMIMRFAFLRAGFLFIYGWLVLECEDAAARGLALVCAIYLPTDLLAMGTGVVNLRVFLLQTHRLRRVVNQATDARQLVPVPTMSTPASWPRSGAVQFDHVWFTYPSSSSTSKHPRNVLRNVSFTVDSGEKIGVVGRTGSGKSSLAMALFRIHELTHGRVLVDGIDVRSLAPHDLRSRLRVIPQAPVFYRCSVRSYLDPVDDFEDEQLWRVLRHTGLASTLILNLAAPLADNGSNWSAGERQLLSLSRALLTPSRVLVLDEAFAALDQARDDTVLELIEHAFARSTVFLITHRMDQVLAFDRVMVMHDGEVAEMGRVDELLRDPDSKFFELLETSPLIHASWVPTTPSTMPATITP
ncbi:TPA: hypothetical protein N0F65_010094 [Lagenidium giganteum]|uniref:ABC transporter domain-containing protein n=1 Tax=Lagenidium giganteum TaxID=4803 RepID=A0AAV2YG29_9STRA|nr:TPA: hypothetical protein N0F65_010094 [Lagenidium giganteum]